MKIDLSKRPNQILFVFLLPILSLHFAELIHHLWKLFFIKFFDYQYPELVHTITVLGAYGILICLLDQYIWKIPIIESLLLRFGIMEFPDVRGVWTANQIKSSYKGVNGRVFRTIFRIDQTMTSISIAANFNESSSQTFAPSFYYDNKMKRKYLQYLFSGETDEGEKYEGHATIYAHDNQLIVSYFNLRGHKQPRFGQLKLRRQSK